MLKLKYILLFVLTCQLALGQNAVLEGYVFEENNRGYLNLAKIEVLDSDSKALLQTLYTNKEGFFTVSLPLEQNYFVRVNKDLFETRAEALSTRGVENGKKLYLKIELKRKPGYIFDVTLAEQRMEDEPVDAITGARIEVFNNTKKEEVLLIEEHPIPTFSVTFESGNHYTIMIRKKGFFTKRMEAYVDIEGCILCFDGVGEVKPGISDNLAHGHKMGTLIANVELQKLALDESIALQNIYYDYNSAKLRAKAKTELDKVITLLRDNPTVILELGSHTDSRGKDTYNQTLSQERAQAAVEYILEQSQIADDRLQAKGYGEAQLTNRCKNGVTCTEEEHQKNRRTELKVLGLISDDQAPLQSLAEILELESFHQLLAEVQSSEEIRVAEGEQLPDEIRVQSTPSKAAPDSPVIPSEEGKKEVEKEPVKATVAEPIEPAVSEPTEELVVISREQPQAKPENMAAPKRTVLEPVAVTPQADRPKDRGESSMRRNINRSVSAEGQSMMVTEFEIITQTAIKRPEMLPRLYNGFKVEIYNAGFELPISHEIFTQHGNIMIEQKKDGSYAYLLGDFGDEAGAVKFLENVILVRYPKAKIIHYQNGNRLAN